MDCLDLTKVLCRICITGDDNLSNMFTKKVKQSEAAATKLIEESAVLDMTLSDALEACTCIEFQRDDSFPETICQNCEHQLIETLSFIHRTKDTQQILDSCARMTEESKKRIEHIDLSEESTYLVEVISENDGNVLGEDECEENLNAANNDCESDAEDAVSFLKKVVQKDEAVADGAPKEKVVKKNHSCNYCKKKFLRKSNLVDHLRLHANVRPFQCSFCDKSFVQSGNLKSHLRTHTKERPFQCLLCTKSYSQSSALKVHYRTHTNERNYGCDVCSKHFTNASDLTKHKRIHDPSSKIACEFCDKKFAQRVNYRNHLRSSHAMQDMPTNIKKEEK